MAAAIYTTTAISSGDGRDGRTELADGSLALDLAIPKELGGRGDAHTPEELFALGYAACFHSSLRFLGRRERADVSDSRVRAEVWLTMTDAGPRLGARLHVALPALEPEEAMALIKSAHEVCTFSAAIRGNVDVDLALDDPPGGG